LARLVTDAGSTVCGARRRLSAVVACTARDGGA